MALRSDPRFSDNGRSAPERRVDEAYERSGIGPGLIVILLAALGLVLLAPTINFDSPQLRVVENNPVHSRVR
jgi:hypothetical protein